MLRWIYRYVGNYGVAIIILTIIVRLVLFPLTLKGMKSMKRMQQLAPRMARAQMEMGGKNPTIVLADADLGFAAKLVAMAGFGQTGQVCTATSRAIVDEKVAQEFTEKLVLEAQARNVRNGMNDGVNMGPAVSAGELHRNLDYVKIAQDEGAELCWGGERLGEGDLEHGHFMSPAVVVLVVDMEHAGPYGAKKEKMVVLHLIIPLI